MFTQDWAVDDTDKGQPLYQMIHNTLYHRIVSESLKPGDHLLECFLAEDMKVSRTPVRKAIIRLEKEGLVRRQRGRAIVESVSCQDIEDTLEIRSALEKLAISDGVCHVTQEGIQCMERANEDFCRTLARGDVLASVEADEAFHDIIYQLSDNRTLLKLIRDFESTMYRFRVRALNTCHDSRILVQEHEAIIQGLKHRDADMAVQAVTKHIERQKGMMLGSCIVKQRPDVC